MISIAITPSQVILVNDGKGITVDKKQEAYGKILSALKQKKSWSKEKAWELATGSSLVAKVSATKKSGLYILDGKAYFGDIKMNEAMTKKLVWLHENGYSFTAIENFYKRCQKNPRKESVDDLFRFLEQNNIPICKDGCFVGYKYVTKTETGFVDSYSKTMDIKIGNFITLHRSKCTSDPNSACGPGLHVGGWNYVGGSPHVILTKVAPEDVVSVPFCSNSGKLRCCRYKALRVYDETGPIKQEYATWKILSPKKEEIF